MNSNSEWLETTERYVVYIRIPGLGEHSINVSHKMLGTLFAPLRKILDDISSEENFLGENGAEHDGPSSSLVQSALFADAILLISRSTEESAVHHLIGSAMRIQMHFLDYGIGVKGGIARGWFTFNPVDLSFFGHPLTEAIVTSKAIEFFGIAELVEDQTLEALERLRQIPEGHIPLVFPTYVPTSSGSTIMNVLNISIAVREISGIKQMHRKLLTCNGKPSKDPMGKVTVRLFEKAHEFTFGNRSA